MMLYIHIPFCVKKCSYCDFLSFSGMEESYLNYGKALKRELALRSKKADKITSIYLGGGTPSLFPQSVLSEILNTVYDYYQVAPDAEVTLECNPKTVTKGSAFFYHSLPINRISIGLQSALDTELLALGRAHNLRDFLDTYDYITQAGFRNISVDVMTGIPKQTTDSLERTLGLVTKLCPTHISTYSLILEEGTPFYEQKEQGLLALPSEEEEFELYHFAIDYLKEAGYKRYEISNYCKKSMYSRHNLGYWDRTPYIGVGLGASSYTNHVRYKNISDLSGYIRLFTEGQGDLDKLFEETTPLSRYDEMNEFIFLGLRKTSGILLKDFKEYFGEDLSIYYDSTLERLEAQNLLVRTPDRIHLTDKGLDISNQVLSELYIDG